MNERYLFRGKRRYDGAWAEGYYYVHTGGHFLTKGTGSGIEIDPATVGQCTGIQDEDGNLIFEGDILEFSTFDYNGADAQHTGNVYWCNGSYWVVCTEREGDEGIYCLGCVKAGDNCLKIIGNIHDQREGGVSVHE